MLFKKQKYDFIFSLGAACACTETLRAAGLQLASYPFDWLFGSDFLGRMDILYHDFNHFMDQADLEFVFSERSILCDAYHNKFNDLTFNHDFKTGLSLEKTYPTVKEKYDRRINRLLKNIKKSNRVLIVFIEPADYQDKASDEDILKGMKKIRSKYNDKTVDLLYMAIDTTFPFKAFEKKALDTGIVKITGNYKHQSPKAAPYVIDIKVAKKWLSKYQLNTSLQIKLKRFFLKTLINLCPFRQKRQFLRKKYHV